MKQQEWEKKFEKEFFPKNAKGKSELVKYQKLLNFVHTNFISREEVERVIEEMGHGQWEGANPRNEDWDDGYNQALTDILKKLDEK